MTEVSEEMLEEDRVTSKHRREEDSVSGTIEKEDGDSGTKDRQSEDKQDGGS